MGRVFVLKAFDRWLKGLDVDDVTLIDTIRLADQGIVAAQLGGELVKLRIARKGGGKSGGYRTIVALRVEDRAIYLLGFAKNEQDNIDAIRLAKLKAFGGSLLRLDDQGLGLAVQTGELREICREMQSE